MSEAWNVCIQLGFWSGRVSIPKTDPYGDPVTAEAAVDFALFAIRDALHANGWTDEHPEEVSA